MKITRNRVFLMLVAGVLALGIVGGGVAAATVSSAHAHGGIGKVGGGDGVSFASRVADKLNEALGLEEDITEAQVQAAFKRGDRRPAERSPIVQAGRTGSRGLG